MTLAVKEVVIKKLLVPSPLSTSRNKEIKFRKFRHYTAATAKSLQSCPTLCDPIDSSPPGSSIPGILQARILEWVTISSSNV